jgi:hypothetical protein
LDAATLDGLWRWTETQNAPSKIAPTNTNTAHTARTLSLNVRSTRRTSIRVALSERLAERGEGQMQIRCCIAAENLLHDDTSQRHEIRGQFFHMNGCVRD